MSNPRSVALLPATLFALGARADAQDPVEEPADPVPRIPRIPCRT